MHEFELLASGFGTVEGPTFDNDGNLYFSDVTGGGVRRLSPDGSIDLIVPRRRGVAGIVAHRDGGIVMSGRDLTHVRGGESRVLLGACDYAANGLDKVTGFADIAADWDGTILAGSVRMADATQKIITTQNDGRNTIARLPGTLVRVQAVGSAQTLIEGFEGGTNGIAVTPWSERIYVAHTRAQEIVVIEPSTTGPRIVTKIATGQISPVGTPDGLALDEDGCLWLALHKGGLIARIGPGGALLQTLAVPASRVDSLCFGGRDRTDLYVVTGDNTDDPQRGGGILRTRIGVRGAPVPMAAI